MTYEQRSELYTAARTLGLLAATLFLSPPAHREAPEPRAGIEATLSLGHRKALAICRKVLGEEHPFTAASYSKVADNQNAQGKYALAETQFKLQALLAAVVRP